MERKIPKRTAFALMNSLKGGVVPRTGLGYIAVGRRDEIDALLSDVDIVEDGGASFRFIVGEYGSGKSFLLQTIRSYVMDRGFAVADADLSPERRFCGTGGQGLATYRELIRNLSVKAQPDGSALELVLEKFITGVRLELMRGTELAPDSEAFSRAVNAEIYDRISGLRALVGGFDFAVIISKYHEAYTSGDDAIKSNALKWLRGEYSTKTEAKKDLGVNGIIGDDNWYEYIKLLADFVVRAGYKGMLMMIDELVHISRSISNGITRQYNYEKLLTIYNDALQGKASHLGIIMCGTPKCVEDTRRGLFSYEALKSRLEDGRFYSGEMKNLMSPIIRLAPLNYEELLVLVEKLTEIHEGLYGYKSKISTTEMTDFLKAELGRIGAAERITPREVIKDYITVLDILTQNPEMSIKSVIGSESFDFSKTSAEEEENVSSEFVDFTL